MSDRRLPIYFLIDTSASMDAESIAKVRKTIQGLVADLCHDVHLPVWMSVVTFGGEAQQAIPLQPLDTFVMPDLMLTGRASLGPALSLLSECRMRETVKGTIEKSGDLRPFVFCFVNGRQLAGSIKQGVNDLLSQSWERLYLIMSGVNPDRSCLESIHPSGIYDLDELHTLPLIKFFHWVTGNKPWWTPISRQQCWGISALGLCCPPPLSDLEILSDAEAGGESLPGMINSICAGDLDLKESYDHSSERSFQQQKTK